MLDALIEDLAELSADPPRAVLLRAEGKLVSGGRRRARLRRLVD